DRRLRWTSAPGVGVDSPRDLGADLHARDPEAPRRLPLLRRLVRGSRRAEAAGGRDRALRAAPRSAPVAPRRSSRAPPAAQGAARLARPHGQAVARGRRRVRAEEAPVSTNGATPRAEGPSTLIAGFLAAGAIFLALFGITQRPVRIEPAAAVLAVIAAGMAGP